MSSPSAAKAAKAALVTVCRTLWPDPVVVFYGPCGTDEPDDYAEILDVTMSEAEARLSPLRQRWHDFAITGRIATYDGGGTEVQQTVTERALDMLAELADYVQDSGITPSTQVTLGSTVQWARLTEWELTEEPDEIEDGRKSTVDFTIAGRLLA